MKQCKGPGICLDLSRQAVDKAAYITKWQEVSHCCACGDMNDGTCALPTVTSAKEISKQDVANANVLLKICL